MRVVRTHPLAALLTAALLVAASGEAWANDAGRLYLAEPGGHEDVLQDIDIETTEVGIDGGEFFIFSDGLTEFAYGDDERLGVTGLIQMVEVSSATPLAERLEAVLAELESVGWQARDDLTVLTIDGTWIRRHG